MRTSHLFNLNDEVVINNKAQKDLPGTCGKIGKISDYITDSNNYHYWVDVGMEKLKVKHSEINPIVEQDAYHNGEKVISLTSGDFGFIENLDEHTGHYEIRYEDGTHDSKHKSLIRKVVEDEEIKEALTALHSKKDDGFSLNEKRRSWDDYFMDIAKTVATRATCDRLHVGCVIVKGKKIVSTGYNGSISGEDHCSEIGHLYNDQGRCVRTIHAEQNAILFSNHNDLAESTAYVTHQPCENCAKLLIQSGVKRIVYRSKYENELSEYFLSKVDSVHLEESEK
ncbi:deoxycytidylate deaminase [Rossellomorea marisflavi]